MINARKVGCQLRWFLLILWILCLACGIFWLLNVFFEYSFGTGLLGTPSMAILGPFFVLLGDLETPGLIVGIAIYLALFFFTQWLFLCPRHIWKIKLTSGGRHMKQSAIGAGFAVGLLSVGLLYSLLDLFVNDIFDILSLEPCWEIKTILSYLFLLIPVILWGLWSVIFFVYRRQTVHYNWLGKMIRGLIAGSVLELLVAIPIYVTREEDCYCARGSYAGLVFGATVLLWAFGPGVFLLFLREKHRRDRLLDFQENSSYD